MKKHAIYPGSFDPLTQGHINLVERALSIFETVTVAVGFNSSKPFIFDLKERVAFIQDVFKKNDQVRVESFEGLLVNFVATKKNATVIRGIRTNMDFEYELAIAQANKHLSPDFETIFMMTDPEYSFLSSSMIREIVSLGGSTKGLVPASIEKALKQKLLQEKRS